MGEPMAYQDTHRSRILKTEKILEIEYGYETCIETQVDII